MPTALLLEGCGAAGIHSSELLKAGPLLEQEVLAVVVNASQVNRAWTDTQDKCTSTHRVTLPQDAPLPPNTCLRKVTVCTQSIGFLHVRLSMIA